jgi:hypothetical protein
MDVTDGNLENFSEMQVWKCTNGNMNQIWVNNEYSFMIWLLLISILYG